MSVIAILDRNELRGDGNEKIFDFSFVSGETTYKEITNTRDFGFESFWSSVGGFVGIFVGYSIMNLSDVVVGFITWLLKIVDHVCNSVIMRHDCH